MNLFITMILVFKVFLWSVRVAKSICINLRKYFLFILAYEFTFLFYILIFQNTIYHIIYFTIHFIKISNILNFFNYFSFITHNNNHQFSFFIIEIRKERENLNCKINNINVNLHNYYSNYVFLYNTAFLVINEFWI